MTLEAKHHILTGVRRGLHLSWRPTTVIGVFDENN